MVKFRYNSIENVNELTQSGFSREQAESFVTVLSKESHDNVYSQKEIDDMLAQTVKDVFKDNQTAVDKVLGEQRREFDKRMESIETNAIEARREMRSTMRWLITTIITVGVAIIGYMHFFHP